MIYAFTGYKQSGKSTASKYLAEKLNATRINFKDRLIYELKLYFTPLLLEYCRLMEKISWDGKPWTIDRLFDEKPPMMRLLMQSYGDSRREVNPDYFVNFWELSYHKSNSTIVTDDTRFKNEAQAVKQLGGVIIRIVREGQISNDTHISETEMSQIEPDYTITVPDGDLESMYRQLYEIVQKTL